MSGPEESLLRYQTSYPDLFMLKSQDPDKYCVYVKFNGEPQLRLTLEKGAQDIPSFAWLDFILRELVFTKASWECLDQAKMLARLLFPDQLESTTGRYSTHTFLNDQTWYYATYHMFGEYEALKLKGKWIVNSVNQNSMFTFRQIVDLDFDPIALTQCLVHGSTTCTVHNRVDKRFADTRIDSMREKRNLARECLPRALMTEIQTLQRFLREAQRELYGPPAGNAGFVCSNCKLPDFGEICCRRCVNACFDRQLCQKCRLARSCRRCGDAIVFLSAGAERVCVKCLGEQVRFNLLLDPTLAEHVRSSPEKQESAAKRQKVAATDMVILDGE